MSRRPDGCGADHGVAVASDALAAIMGGDDDGLW
jgi:hypothetical protein